MMGSCCYTGIMLSSIPSKRTPHKKGRFFVSIINVFSVDVRFLAVPQNYHVISRFGLIKLLNYASTCVLESWYPLPSTCVSRVSCRKFVKFCPVSRLHPSHCHILLQWQIYDGIMAFSLTLTPLKREKRESIRP